MKRKSQTLRMPKDCREVQEAMDRASWDAIEVAPDVWDRLEADRRQALEDDLEWIRRGRKETAR